LPDGDYTATIAPGAINDASGNASTQPYAADFFVLAADANRDRTVDFIDLVALAQNYNTTDKSRTQGDFNYDHNVDFNDLVLLAQRYNTTLDAAAAPPVASAAAQAAVMAMFAPPPTTAATVSAHKYKDKSIFATTPIKKSTAPPFRSSPMRRARP
jgi:hypothetical protein